MQYVHVRSIVLAKTQHVHDDISHIEKALRRFRFFKHLNDFALHRDVARAKVRLTKGDIKGRTKERGK